MYICILCICIYIYNDDIRKHMKMTKVVEFMSFTSHPIHSLVATIAEDSCLFFSQACRPHLRSLGRAWKNADKMIPLTDLVFLGDGLKSKRSLKSFIFGFFVKFSASDEIERGFLSQFFLAPFQNHGWAKCTHKGNCTGNPSCRSQRSANGRPWHKKKRDNSPRETQRQEPQGTPELRVKKYPFRVS